jgi:hypothetical protein
MFSMTSAASATVNEHPLNAVGITDPIHFGYGMAKPNDGNFPAIQHIDTAAATD